jgi:hypothetical protein
VCVLTEVCAFERTTIPLDYRLLGDHKKLLMIIYPHALVIEYQPSAHLECNTICCTGMSMFIIIIIILLSYVIFQLYGNYFTNV